MAYIIVTRMDLLECIMNADHQKAFLIIDKYPESMFQTVKQKDGSLISPLKHAFKTYDTATWKHFFETIKNDPDLYYQFEQQKKEQTRLGCLDVQALIDDYAQYNKDYQSHLDGRTSKWEMNTAWRRFSDTQRELLPAHMIKKLYPHISNHSNPPAEMASPYAFAHAINTLYQTEKAELCGFVSHRLVCKA